MIRVIHTLDYEIHGNGEGRPRDLMIEPTDRLIRLFDEYSAKLTIMADVAEIIKFKEYKELYGRDDYCYEAVADQLRRAIIAGHDVQLHIHPSYFNASHDGQRWVQDWQEYSFTDLAYDRINWMIRTSKDFLENLIKPADPSYRCTAFRAANWCVNPSRNVVRALIENDITIDTSVFKFGRRQGIVNFDYSSAHHPFIPWPASADDICSYDHTSPLWEFPIYSEKRWIGAFATLNRVYRAMLGKLHKIPGDFPNRLGQHAYNNKRSLKSWLFQKHAWKADFNQCSGRQLIHAVLRAEKSISPQTEASFILIGHPKLFTRLNELSLRSFLSFIKKQEARFSFSTLHLSFDNSNFFKTG